MKKTHPILVDIETVRPYRTVTGDSLYTIQPPAMQIEEFLPVGGIMGITAQPGVGKSWIAQAICKSVGGGEPFLGKFKARRGGCLYVGSDSSLYDYARQWTRLTSNTEAAAHVYEPVRFLIQSSFMFEDRDEVRKLIATHRSYEWGDVNEQGEREKGFHVIVFDTVSKLTRANQNDNTEMEEVFRHIRWIAEATDAAIILLHHNSRRTEFNDGDSWRGASSGDGALDSRIQLTPSKKDKFVIGVEFKKFRGITPESFAYRMNVMDRTPGSSASLVYDETHTESIQSFEKQPKVADDSMKKLIVAALAGGVKLRVPDLTAALWEKTKPGTGGDVQFGDMKKLDRAIRNRIPTLLMNAVIYREVSGGRAVYMLPEVKGKPSGPVVEVGAQPASVASPSDQAPPQGVVSAAGAPGSRRRSRAVAPSVRAEEEGDSGSR